MKLVMQFNDVDGQLHRAATLSDIQAYLSERGLVAVPVYSLKEARYLLESFGSEGLSQAESILGDLIAIS